MRKSLLTIFALFAPLAMVACHAIADDAAAPATKPDASKMPHITIDVKAKQVRVECEALKPEMPLEFFCCMSGTAEHEAVLRSSVRPQHLHLGLLMLGLKPGEPVRYSPAAEKRLPPHGPPIQIFCEWVDKAGKGVRVPAYRLMRNVKTKKEMPPMTWIFAGSQVMPDGVYAADKTGYIVSVVNFEMTVIDIPELASSANESLEWEINPATMPDKGAKVWMVIEPAAKVIEKKVEAENPLNPPALANGAAGGGGASATADKGISDVRVDEQKVKTLRSKWDNVVAPRNKALREAAQAHYEVITALRKEQNRLIDEADRVQRVIDQLQKEYQEMTTPQAELDFKEPADEKTEQK